MKWGKFIVNRVKNFKFTISTTKLMYLRTNFKAASNLSVILFIRVLMSIALAHICIFPLPVQKD